MNPHDEHEADARLDGFQFGISFDSDEAMLSWWDWYTTQDHGEYELGLDDQ